MLSVADLDRLIRRPCYRTAEELRMEGPQIKGKPVKRQAGRPQTTAQSGDQADLVDLMAFVANQPLDHLGDG